MFKNKIILAIAAATVAITACEAIYEQPIPSQESIPVDQNSVSLSKAMTVANHYVQGRCMFIPTKAKGLDIKDYFTLEDANDLPIIHTINYKRGGFVIVSGDDRTYPILAYSENGYLPRNSDSYPGGLKIWLEDTCAEINYLRKNGDKADSLTKSIWERFEKENSATRSQPNDTVFWENLYDNSIGPLISTTWHQDTPYNDTRQWVEYGNSYVHAAVGCVPVAIAQLMRFFGYPTSYSWSLMPNNTANSYLYALINDIWTYLGSNIEPGYPASSVPHSFDIGYFLKNSFGYASATQINYTKYSDYVLVRDELLENERPVIFKGTSGGHGHAWVCDGVHEWQEDVVIEGQHHVYGHMQFHHIWGWQDNSPNGWYAFSAFSPTDTEYNLGHNMKLVYNIHP